MNLMGKTRSKPSIRAGLIHPDEIDEPDQTDQSLTTLTIRSSRRRALDQRLSRHEDRVGPPPLQGWIRAIREALVMSQFELGERMGLSQPRVAQIERAEAEGSVQLETIRRSAAALGCSFWYVLVPNEPLDRMVRRQALHLAGGDPVLAIEVADRPGLWRGYSLHPPPPIPRGRPPEEGT
jgi:predicted DNA-binding mobile mystery protein A